LYVPETDIGVVLDTSTVLTEKVALLAPCAMVTLGGTVATAVLLLVSAIVAPPAGAKPFNVTAPVAVLPPITAAGLRETVPNVAAAGFTERIAVCVPL